MDYIGQVQRGIDYIEEHLNEDIELAAVSRVAGVSHWHFQRIFRALTGETLKTYIRARRFAAARVALVTTDAGVLEIALNAGFDSQASFTRAFKRAFGIPPARYRSGGDEYLFMEKARIDEEYLQHLRRNLSPAPEKIDRLPERHMVGAATLFFSVDSERNNIGEKIPPLWDAFLPRRGEIEGAVEGYCYGVVRQAEADNELLEYTAAMEVPRAPDPQSVPPDMVHVTVPEATYATFTHRGTASLIDQTVNYIYSTWLTRSGRRHSYGPDLEIYDSRWHATSPDSVMEYAIPLA
ncbi:MAG: AraC family transcriptional regulator [Spirochaetales bacterium]|nr:AraC family transcriptional regulator [Spirochaetales bacterium]